MPEVFFIKAITKIFENFGFTVIEQPKIIGKSYLPLRPDMIAGKGNTIYVVEVKYSKDVLQYPAESAQIIKYSSDLLITSEDVDKDIKGVLILVGGKQSISLKMYSEEENIKVLTFNEEDLKYLYHHNNASSKKLISKLFKEIIKEGI